MKICPEHNKPFSEKSPNKGGFYWHVINFENSEYCSKTKADYDAIADKTESSVQEVREPLKERDYDAENRGKVRNNLIEALIGFRGLQPITPSEKVVIDGLVDYVMSGV